jgi:hypothetical protein
VFREHNVRVNVLPPHLAHIWKPMGICWVKQFKALTRDLREPAVREVAFRELGVTCDELRTSSVWDSEWDSPSGGPRTARLFPPVGPTILAGCFVLLVREGGASFPLRKQRTPPRAIAGGLSMMGRRRLLPWQSCSVG